MPELPEVETIVRGLRERLVGETVSAVQVRWPRAVALQGPDDFAEALIGREVVSVWRRGKFLVFQLHDAHLLVHLRMTGQLLLDCASAPLETADCQRDPHVHVVIHFASGSTLYYRDVRKFGRLYLLDDPAPVLGPLGPEPLDLDLTPQAFGEMLRGRRRRLKDLMLDQTFLAGLGNIYVDEALWEARLSPLRVASSLSPDDANDLLAAVRGVLRAAIDARGTTFSDFRDEQDRPGDNQRLLHAYGRAGAPCPRCGSAIERAVVGGRGTHYCPTCQPAPVYAAGRGEREAGQAGA